MVKNKTNFKQVNISEREIIHTTRVNYNLQHTVEHGEKSTIYMDGQWYSDHSLSTGDPLVISTKVSLMLIAVIGMNCEHPTHGCSRVQTPAHCCDWHEL